MSSGASRSPTSGHVNGAPLDRVIAVDVAAIVEPDVAIVEALARLQLAARRAGRTVCLENASKELAELVDLMALREVLRLEPRRQPEQRKERLGVEKGRELDDPAV